MEYDVVISYNHSISIGILIVNYNEGGWPTKYPSDFLDIISLTTDYHLVMKIPYILTLGIVYFAIFQYRALYLREDQ